MAPKRKRNATEPVQPPASLAKARPKARLGKAASHVEAQKWFTKYDRDGNGVLDHDEYCELLKSIGTEHDKLHPKYVQYFLKLTDGDGDGVVSLEEFTRVYDKLVHFDDVLRAPRREPPPSAAKELPEASSRLKGQASLLCPAVPTLSIELDDQTFVVEEGYSKVKVIGEGAYGLVCMATDGEGKDVAIKKVRPTSDVLQLRCCLRELAILQHFGQHPHPNLLGLRTVMRPPEGHIAEWHDLYLVTELLDSDLHQARARTQILYTHMDMGPGPGVCTRRAAVAVAVAVAG